MPPWPPEPVMENSRATVGSVTSRSPPSDDGSIAAPSKATRRFSPASELEWALAAGRTRSDSADGRVHAAGNRRGHFTGTSSCPIPGGETRYVKAWEFLPGNTRVVHHATMQFDTAGSSRELDALDPEPGYEGLIAHSVASPDGFFLDWGPGHSPYVAPDGMAWPLRPGTDLVMMLHLRPSGRIETLEGTLGSISARNHPRTRRPSRLTRQNLDIPPGVPLSGYRLGHSARRRRCLHRATACALPGQRGEGLRQPSRRNTARADLHP